uniref:Secretogranin-1 n=1 Tax=Molossus molossus TaxID=27622 RepID=A0A7J8HFV5_MOLMO|nr:chromogranin B [Molossus molossus]
MQRAVLLGLLGATMVAAVSSMPVDNRNYNEEMVTRCIIEVLSNALSKSNAPPISPECRQVLKKSGKEVKDEEKSKNENTRFEVRLLRDQADASEAHRPSSREDTGAPGAGDTQGPSAANAEGDGPSREGAGEPEGTLYPSDSQVSKEAKTHHSGKSEGEDKEEEEGEKYQNREHGDGGSEEKHLEEPGETPNAFLDKRNQATTKKKEELVSRYSSHAARLPEEKTHSRERSSQESREETRTQAKRPQESKSQTGSQEESEESEEDSSHEVDKRRSRPRHHHGWRRPGRSSEERDKRDRYPTHYRASEEEPEYEEEGRSYAGVQAPENLEKGRHGGRGREKYGAPRPPSEESQEEEDKRNRPNSQLDNMAYGYGEESEEERGPAWGDRHGAGAREPGAYSTPDRDGNHFMGGGHSPVQENQLDKARRLGQGQWKEQDRNDLSYGEEAGEQGARGKWQQLEDLQDPENREEARLPGKQYTPYPAPEKRRRLGELLNPYYAPSQGKGSQFDRKDNIDDRFLEGEDENGLTLNEKNFFPEYNYDWWEKKPFEEDVNWRYEKRNLAPKLDLKRQYDRVAELDQLLHYRKKSAEFPDFYDVQEPLSPRHAAGHEKDRAGPGALTEEEEKELENLAAMDLELQKIAEKFSNRRG